MSILNFDSRALDALLGKYGLRQCWINILATHVSPNRNLNYILRSKEFKNFTHLDSDLIQNLTIGEIGVLYEYSVARVDRESRKSNGQFFTPDDVAAFMASQSNNFPKGIWLDPCSGIGNLSWHLAASQKDPEQFLIKNLKLSDKDELALLIARTLLTSSFQKKSKNLFNEIKSNFFVVDFLDTSDPGIANSKTSQTKLDLIPKHDYAILNPPYLATEKDERFYTSRAGDLYAYFLENVIKTSQGFISITPQSFTNAAKFNSLRTLLINNYKNLKIYNFDNVPANIFKGIKFGSQNSNTANSIRASIMVAISGPGKRSISPLIRWRSSERGKLFQVIDQTLSNVELTEEYFPKVGKKLESLYFEMSTKPRLGSLISKEPTKFALYVPASPRYFIPALLSPVKRASQKTLYFNNSDDQMRAYLLINSSFMYWWWRVRDGGMTLSVESLKSVPIPDFEIDQKLIKLLMNSEKINKVYKKNAGEDQENVKHPKDLIESLNYHIFPKHAKILGELHQNSDIDTLTP